MLTTKQMDEFNLHGIVRMPGAVEKSAAEEMQQIIWNCLRERYHIHRDAPDTWPKPDIRRTQEVQQIAGTHRFLGNHHVPKSVTFAQVGSAAVCAALDQLLLPRNWQQPARWGSLLVTFPESIAPWDVPSSNWHLDLPASRSYSGLTAVRLFTCLAKLAPGGGGTVFVSGSHKLVQNLTREGESIPSGEARKRLIRAYPWIGALCSREEKADRIHRFMDQVTSIDRVEVRVVEMTGEPGDVILVHPMILHAPVKNCSSEARFALSSTVFRTGVAPMRLYP
jgi:ectoine hydroxylase-related dioxygenase (phytanoyl-CoA dioxygenase family)